MKGVKHSTKPAPKKAPPKRDFQSNNSSQHDRDEQVGFPDDLKDPKDRAISAQMLLTRNSIDFHRSEQSRYEEMMRKLIKQAKARDWSNRRVSVLSGIENPVEWARAK